MKQGEGENTVRSSLKDKLCLILQFTKKPKTVLLASICMCINTHSKAQTHTPRVKCFSPKHRWLQMGNHSDLLLHLLPSLFSSLSLLSSPQFLPLVSYFSLSFPSLNDFSASLTIFSQLSLVFFSLPLYFLPLLASSSCLFSVTPLSFLSFLQSPAEEAQNQSQLHTTSSNSVPASLLSSLPLLLWHPYCL